MADSAPPVIRFRAWVGENLERGWNLRRKESYYVSLPSLKDYWTDHNIDQILDLYNIEEDPKDIKESYLRIFSVLVHVGFPGPIRRLMSRGMDDNYFPAIHSLQDLGHDFENIRPQVLEEQWKFFPLIIGSPVMHKRSSAVPIVFKTYSGVNGKRLYKSETAVYKRLMNQKNEGITRYYGSFYCCGVHEEPDIRVIMLEYAQKGTLLEFLKTTRPPESQQDISKLWTRLFRIFDVLFSLHSLSSSATKLMRGIHKDIHPNNILVFEENNESPFNVFFKLADFGLAEINGDTGPSGLMEIKHGGSRMYFKRQVIPEVVDLWALGAVYSEVLVWSLAGFPAIERFRQERHNFILTKCKHLEASKYDACFHDGLERLSVVDDFLQEVLSEFTGDRTIASAMMRIILDQLLVNSPSQKDALTIRTAAEKALSGGPVSDTRDSSNNQTDDQNSTTIVPGTSGINRAEVHERVSLSGERTPDLERPPALPGGNTHPIEIPGILTGLPTGPDSHELQGQDSLEEYVPVDYLHTLLTEKDSSRFSLRRLLGKSQGGQDIVDLPGMRRAKQLISDNGGRDQIMLIDNSWNTFRYKSEVEKAARVISYWVKGTDTDGMDLYFASDSSKPKKCFDSRDVEKAIRKAAPMREKCNMTKCLENVMEPVCQGELRNTSVYIFTDGRWENDKDEVKLVIMRAMANLTRPGHFPPPSRLMFQFVQVGPRMGPGVDNMQYLDDKCKVEHNSEIYY
ncbi:serine/threonine protein kinase [Fusarium austroafricanum]|uniref:non-specific serine/threonine protein kinase n=1 Tax=Fusarium austroafricanum TaxID=2364996 RepID=A0A8H4K148_9HYPO|nr:serine/threonine protein kinase [Fusarium austroafricanum]